MLGKLKGTIQNYHWGIVSPDGRVSRYAAEQIEGTPYAELWFGAHPKSPSQFIWPDGVTAALDALIGTNAQQMLGSSVVNEHGPDLPFLVKFISINPAFGLSIQVHPNKDQAVKLNRAAPDVYPDSRGKPELAVALTPSALLHGFKSLSERQAVYQRFPSFSSFLSHDADIEQTVKRIFEASDEERSCVSKDIAQSIDQDPNSSHSDKAFMRLYNQYSVSDSGLLLFHLLNFVELAPGQAIFTSPGTLHAYLEGELLEILANSDNVVRGGLTPKPRDVPNLLDIAVLKETSPAPIESIQGAVFSLYELPVREFSVKCLDRFTGAIAIPVSDRPGLIVSLGGKVQLSVQAHFITPGGSGRARRDRVSLSEGEAAFFGADEELVWAECEDAVLYVISCG